MTTNADGAHRDRLVERDGRPGELAQHVSPPHASLGHLGRGHRGGCGLDDWRHIALHHGLEEMRRDSAEGRWRSVFCSAAQAGRSAAASSFPPAACVVSTQCGEGFRRQRDDVEAHVGEAVAAELRREAGIGAGLVGLQVQLRRHARHGVDLAAELRHEEAVHHRRRGQAEADRRRRRHDQPVDAGDALARVDEQPLPVERHDLDFERRASRRRSALSDRDRASRSRRCRRGT